MRVRAGFVAGIALLAVAPIVRAGGWAIVTAGDLPEYAVAGKRFQLTFMVRQHGGLTFTPFEGLKLTVTATSGTDVAEVAAVATENAGEYTASLVLPRAGQWTVRIARELGVTARTLPELTVIAPGTSSPPPLSQVALGERLFVAKGCLACHLNRDVQAEDESLEVGPDLTARRFPERYLKSLLADPKATLARRSDSERGGMPDLGLKQTEIAALVAFINREPPLKPSLGAAARRTPAHQGSFSGR